MSTIVGERFQNGFEYLDRLHENCQVKTQEFKHAVKNLETTSSACASQAVKVKSLYAMAEDSLTLWKKEWKQLQTEFAAVDKQNTDAYAKTWERVKTDAGDRKGEWTAMKKISCILTIRRCSISKKTGCGKAEACKKPNQQTSHLDVKAGNFLPVVKFRPSTFQSLADTTTYEESCAKSPQIGEDNDQACELSSTPKKAACSGRYDVGEAAVQWELSAASKAYLDRLERD